MKTFSLKFKEKKFLSIVLGSIIGAIVVIIFLNFFAWIKLCDLENKVKEQKKELNQAIVEQVTEIVHDPIYMAGGSNKIETETLINTEELLNSAQVEQLKEAVINEVQKYVTEDVYLGVKELLLEELKAGLEGAVTEAVSDVLSEEQMTIIISTIQEKVLEETTASIKRVSKEMTSNNKLVKSLETTVTVLKGRIDTLETTISDSLYELESKDKELESAINQLRLAFVTGNIGTTDLSILSVQMATNSNILSECENALLNNLTEYSRSERDTYLTAISSYRDQIKNIEKLITERLDGGNSSAGDELAISAAELSKNIVEFGTMIENAKISLDAVKMQLQEEIDTVSSDLSMVKAATTNNASEITNLQEAKKSLERADNSLFAISEALQAADQALEQTSSENLDIALSKITSLVGSIPEGSTVASQLSKAQIDLEAAKLNLETAIAEGNAEAIAEAENTAANALAVARNEIETSIESIIGDIPDGETIASLFDGVDIDINQVKTDLSTANEKLVTAKAELETAIASGNAEAVANAEEKVNTAKAELNRAITNAQTGLQSNIDTIEGEITALNNAVTEANTKLSDLKTEVDEKASQSDLETTTNEINQDLQNTKEDINNALDETTENINNSIANKADKSELDNVMKADVSTDANGKTTITISVE